jgi:hypothetical protein
MEEHISSENENIQDMQEETEEIEELGFGDKLMALLTEPMLLFENIRHKPDWIKPLILLLVFVLISSALITQLVVVPNLPKYIAENPNISEEDKAEMLSDTAQMDRIKLISSISGILSPVIGNVVSVLILAVILFSFATLMGSNMGFIHHFSLVVYTSLINILGMIVRVPLVIFKSDPYMTTSLANILPAEKIGTPMYTLLSQFDPFTIWTLVLTALGFSVINKATKGKGFAIVFGLWVLWVALLMVFGKFIGFGM